jgi:hypothetical protein
LRQDESGWTDAVLVRPLLGAADLLVATRRFTDLSRDRMTDDMTPINFDDFKERKPKAPRRKNVVPPVETSSDDPGVLAAALVADSTALEGKTPEEIAVLMIRRMANVVLLGGDAFLPKNLNEATNSAKAWASIASLERARKQGQGSVVEDTDEVSRMAARALGQLRPFQKARQ